jgi:hypothetical protein
MLDKNKQAKMNTNLTAQISGRDKVEIELFNYFEKKLIIPFSVADSFVTLKLPQLGAPNTESSVQLRSAPASSKS